MLRLLALLGLLFLATATHAQGFHKIFNLKMNAIIFTYKPGCQSVRQALRTTGGIFAINAGYFWPLTTVGKIRPKPVDLLVVNKRQLIPYRYDLARPVFASNPKTLRVDIFRRYWDCPSH